MEKLKKMSFKEICQEKCQAKAEFIRTLQEATGVNLTTVYRWVGGFATPAPRDRRAIAKALGASVEELFGEV